jgi:hypothetical protein
MRFKQTEILIRISPAATATSNLAKAQRKFRNGESLVATERPFTPRCREMKVPQLQRATHAELMFRLVDQRFLQIVRDLCRSPDICAGEIPHNFCAGESDVGFRSKATKELAAINHPPARSFAIGSGLRLHQTYVRC